MYSEVFLHTQELFFILLLGIHLSFIGWSFDLSKLSLNAIIIFLHFSARRGWTITGRTVIFSFWDIRGVFFSSLFLWIVVPSFMVIIFLVFVCWMGRLSMRVYSVKFWSKASFIAFWSFISSMLSHLKLCSSACRLYIVCIRLELNSTTSYSSQVWEFRFPYQLLSFPMSMIWTIF